MEAVRAFSRRKPVLFVLVLLAAWMILVSAIAGLTGHFLKRPLADPLVQSAGTLAATLLFLTGVYRLGWLRETGITSLGILPAWIGTMFVSVYVLGAGFLAYFGDFSFEVGTLLHPEAWPILLQGVRAGFVEEVIYRGIILYVLVSAWGKTKRGLVIAVILQAALFALPHALQFLAGVDPASAISNVLATFIFGLWTGLLAIAASSVWPAIFLHAASNAFTLIKGLSSAWITPYYMGYFRGALAELPLVLIGTWIVLKLRENQVDDSREPSEPLARG